LSVVPWRLAFKRCEVSRHGAATHREPFTEAVTMTTTTTPTAGGIGGPDRAPAELLDVSQVAALVNRSPPTVYRLAAGGTMPRPLRVGSLVRWRADELRRWIAGGCPPVRAVKVGPR